MDIKKSYTSTLSKEALFNAWISSDMTIAPVTKIECNPTIGWILKLYSPSKQGMMTMTGEFVDIVPHERLKYSWQWDGFDEKTIITVNFKQEKDQTVITILHEGFLTKESKNMHDTGWDHYFSGLEQKIKFTL